MGLGFMNQAQKDSHVDNYNFAIYSLQLYPIYTKTQCMASAFIS